MGEVQIKTVTYAMSVMYNDLVSRGFRPVDAMALTSSYFKGGYKR